MTNPAGSSITPALAQAYALRAQLDALVLFLEVAEGIRGTVAVVGCPTCGASIDKVEDVSTIGQKASRCTVCGAEWDR
jgi:hypothetical protein